MVQGVFSRSLIGCLLIFQVLACSDAAAPVESKAFPDINFFIDALDANYAEFAGPQPPSWPDDFATHPSMRSESFILQAIIQPAQGHVPDNSSRDDTDGLPAHVLDKPFNDKGPVASIILQIDRLGLTAKANSELAASDWQYSDVMRSVVSVDARIADSGELTYQQFSAFKVLATTPARQRIQRMALGLASVEGNTLSTRNDRLAIQLNSVADTPCRRQYRWIATVAQGMRALLDFSMDTCPEGQSIGLLSRWQQSLVKVTGFLISNPSSQAVYLTPVEGNAWFSQQWGNLPGTGGAVAIDTLQLTLDDDQVLNVSRSKRRSGRGPQTVSATISSPSLPTKSLELNWEDSADQRSSDSQRKVPASIRLVSADQSIDLEVTMLNRWVEAGALAGDQLQAAVWVDGTHRGAGFLSYVAPEVSF